MPKLRVALDLVWSDWQINQLAFFVYVAIHENLCIVVEKFYAELSGYQEGKK